jgi:hypothetical protein
VPKGKTPTPGAVPDELLGEVEDLVARAQAGDAAAAPRLREVMALYPELWERNGDLAQHATLRWVHLAAGTDLYLREAATKKAEAMRAELLAEGDGPLVRLLADRVVATWVEANYMTGLQAQGIAANEGPRTLASRADRRHRAERNHLAAVAALAAVRRLLPTGPKALPAPAHRLTGYFAGRAAAAN